MKKAPADRGDDLAAAPSYSLAVTPDVRFDIVVTDEVHDNISRAIAQNTYGFPHPFHLLANFVRRGARVLDLGAHIGTFSLFAASLGYEVLAIEASPRTAALLEASAARNRFDNLTVVSAAVTDRVGEVQFLPAGPYGFVANPMAKGPLIRVPAVRVDDVLATLGWGGVEFVKLDVEGSEVAAVRGMSQLLAPADAPMILFESNGYTLSLFGETPNSLMLSLEVLGYSSYLVGPNELIPVRSRDLQPECNVDCLALKQPPAVLRWPVRAPLSTQEIIARIASCALSPNMHLRGYVGQALARSEAGFIVDDPQIRRTLESLKADPEDYVRNTVAWYPRSS